MDSTRLIAGVLAGRPALFGRDFSAHAGRISEELSGRTVCVVGAGGSIGRATVATLLAQRPRRTLLVDSSENNLVEITRQMRNTFPSGAPDFEAWAMDFTRPVFAELLNREQPDIVLNFAAFKHVRSEKDVLTLAEMLRVNVLGNLALVRWALDRGGIGRLFSISTDKAANPANCMGASKRLMEHLLFCRDKPGVAAATTTSTRFANVLFSDGSLPASFLKRLETRQPLAGPSDVKRYFIAPAEAGALCLLAAFHDADGEILVPRMREADMLDFPTIAGRLLGLHGFEARDYGGDIEAAFGNLDSDIESGRWPCLFEPARTSGEKAFEEFSEAGEADSADQPYAEIRVLRGGDAPPWERMALALDSAAADFMDPQWLSSAAKDDLVRLLQSFVTSFSHIDPGLSLDRVV